MGHPIGKYSNSKFSCIHFCSCKIHRQKFIQLKAIKKLTIQLETLVHLVTDRAIR